MDWVKKPDNGGSAFPSTLDANGFFPAIGEEGMSLRDVLANDCPITMKEFLNVYGRSEIQDLFGDAKYDTERGEFLKMFAKFRYEYADAMIAEKRRTEGDVA